MTDAEKLQEATENAEHWYGLWVKTQRELWRAQQETRGLTWAMVFWCVAWAVTTVALVIALGGAR